MAQAQNVRLLSRARNLQVIRDACRVASPIGQQLLDEQSDECVATIVAFIG